MIPGLWDGPETHPSRPEEPASCAALSGPSASLRESGTGCGLLGPTVICFEVGFMVRLRGVTHGSEEEGQYRHVWVQKGLFFDAGSGSFDSVPHFRYFKPGA